MRQLVGVLLLQEVPVNLASMYGELPADELRQ
jgi:hypothetical protein